MKCIVLCSAFCENGSPERFVLSTRVSQFSTRLYICIQILAPVGTTAVLLNFANC